MKYIILSIYDSWYKYSCNINGNFYDEESDICKKLYNTEWGMYPKYNSSINDYLLNEYSDYDLIVVCEDGNIEILKG